MKDDFRTRHVRGRRHVMSRRDFVRTMAAAAAGFLAAGCGMPVGEHVTEGATAATPAPELATERVPIPTPDATLRPKVAIAKAAS